MYINTILHADKYHKRVFPIHVSMATILTKLKDSNWHIL